MRFLPLCALLVSVGATSTPNLREHHDGSFSPDAVLRVDRGRVNVGGIRKISALVNGTLPGPTVRIPEDKVVWIRVYNDMSNANLTMVSRLR